LSMDGRGCVRALTIVVLIVLSMLGVAGVVLLAVGLLVVPVRTVTHSGRLPPVWAFPGVAFRPLSTRVDTTGWRVAYVLAGKDQTLVLSTAGVSAQGTQTGLVTLADTHGHAYAEQPAPSIIPPTDMAGHYYAVNVFAPLQRGTTAVLVHHNVHGGGTAYVPINLRRIASVSLPIHPHVTRRSGGISVTLVTLTRGALLSQVDLSARGFADPGGEVTNVGNNGTIQRPAQAPVAVIMHTSSGLDLAPEVASGPVDNGAVTTSIGFRTPPRGTLITLSIDNYELSDLPPNRRTTRGHWVFTFKMP